MKVSRWYDVVFHVLASLPVSPADSSRLFSPAYRSWVEERLPAHRATCRTLAEDAGRIARLYDAGGSSAQLSFFAVLYSGWSEFRRTLGEPFSATARRWPDPTRTAMAAAVAALPHELVELFRIALWSEARCGYLELHRRHVANRRAERLRELGAWIERLASRMRGLERARIVVCHPLRHHGRLFWLADGPELMVGLPSEELAVPGWSPALQAAHEHVLSRVLVALGERPPADPRSGAPGFVHHLGPELVALSVAARILGTGEGELFCRWLARWLPNDTGALLDQLPWRLDRRPSATPLGIEGVVAWLAAGELLPAELRAVCERVHRELAR